MISEFPDSIGIDELQVFSREAEHPADRSRNTTVVGHVPPAPYIEPAVVVDGSAQFVAFYDAERWLTIAHRDDWGMPWKHHRLDSRLAWDSHNYPSIAVDRGGFVHVAANMHAAPMTYFRSERPRDPSTLVRLPTMVRPEFERSVTYPEFVIGPEGALSYWFRDGSSGDGVQRVYRHDDETHSWSALNDVPLIDGLGLSSAYLEGNRCGVDANGYWLTWVWRDSPDAETTHSVSYAQSPDLVHWFTADGEQVELPINPGSPTTIAEPEPGSGLINNNVRSTRSPDGAPMIVFHSRDHQGHMQLRTVSRTAHGWHNRALTDWDLRWDFSGRGTLQFELEVGEPLVRDGWLHVPIRHLDRIIAIRSRGDTVTAAHVGNSLMGIKNLASTDEVRAVTTPKLGPRSAAAVWRSSPQNRDLPVDETSSAPHALKIIRMDRS